VTGAPRPSLHAERLTRQEARRPIWGGDFLAAQVLSRDVERLGAGLRGRLLDVGCGNARYRGFLPAVDRYVGYDLDTAAARPDVCGAADRLPFREASFDSVLFTQVLEHVPSPDTALREIHRILRPGGRMLLSAPQHWRIHEAPYDFWRFTRFGLERLLGDVGFEIEELSAQGGVWRLVGQAVNNAIVARLGAGLIAHGAFVVVNATALLLERIWRDEEDTLNYVALARKPWPE
jgi:SAM-dependent methyltransferase